MKINYKPFGKIGKIRLSVILLAVSVFFVLNDSTAHAASSVALSAAPSVQTVTVGQTANYTINLRRDGYAGKVTLSAGNLPAGVTAVFNPNPAAGNSSVLTLKTSARTPAGIFNITVKGAGAGITIAPISVKLEIRPAASISISVLPQAKDIVAGQSADFEIAIDRQNFNGLVALAAEDLPAGVEAVFEPQTTDGNSSRMRLYSNGLPSFWQDYQIRATARPINELIERAETLIRLRVNCNVVWVEQFAAPNNQTGHPDFAKAVAFDGSGNVYVAGETHIPEANGNFNGNFDAWAAKYDSTGRQLWLRTVAFSQQNAEERATHIAVDGGGNVYVAGYRQSGAGAVNYDIFFAKFDSNGVQTPNPHLLGGGAEDGASGMVIKFDAAGNVVLTAVTDVEHVNVPNTVRTLPSADYKIRRFVFNGSFSQTGNTVLVDDGVGKPQNLAVGNDDSIYTIGAIPDLNIYDTEAWVEKYDAGGALEWRTIFSFENRMSPFDPFRDDKAKQLAVDATENVFVSGSTRYLSPGGSGEILEDDVIWLMKFDPAGNRSWLVSDPFYSTGNIQVVNSLGVDAGGNVFAAGHTTNDFDLNAPPSANSDAWFAKYGGGDGRIIFQKVFAVPDKDSLQSIAVVNADTLLLAGTTVAFKNLNYGYEDALAMKFSLMGSLLAPFISSAPAMVTSGNTFTVNGSFFSADALYFGAAPLAFTIVSPSEIRATAPFVPTARTHNLRITGGCLESVSPTQTTVRP